MNATTHTARAWALLPLSVFAFVVIFAALRFTSHTPAGKTAREVAAQVQVGMSVDEVLKIAGPPSSTLTEKDESGKTAQASWDLSGGMVIVTFQNGAVTQVNRY